MENPLPVDAQYRDTVSDTPPSLEAQDEALVDPVQKKPTLRCVYHEGTLIAKVRASILHCCKCEH